MLQVEEIVDRGDDGGGKRLGRIRGKGIDASGGRMRIRISTKCCRKG